MSNRGYSFESEIEEFFLKLENKTKQDPIIDSTGKICRTFRVPTSGAMASFPGDVITSNLKFKQQFMIECKARYDTTKKLGQVFRLDMNWVTKNEEEARKAGYLPLFFLSFKRTKQNRIWAIIDNKVIQLLNIKVTAVYNYSRKKKSIILVKRQLDTNPTSYKLGNRYLVPFEIITEKIRKWSNT